MNNLTSSLFSQPAQEPRNTCEPERDEIVKVWVGNVGLNPKRKTKKISEHLESWISTANLVCICFVFEKMFPFGLVLILMMDLSVLPLTQPSKLLKVNTHYFKNQFKPQPCHVPSTSWKMWKHLVLLLSWGAKYLGSWRTVEREFM